MRGPVDDAVRLFREGLFCSEAIVNAFNTDLNLGLDQSTLKVATAFCSGLGGAKCSCGSLTGALVVLGALLGRTAADEPLDRLFPLVREVHDSFRTRFGQSCCRSTPPKHSTCEKYVAGAAQLLWDTLLENYHLVKELQYKGKHTLALFRLVWPRRGQGVTECSIPQLMQQLSLSHTRYSYGQLKLRVLEPAFSEIYAWDDSISIAFGPSFSGRRVEGVWFEVQTGEEARALRAKEPAFRVAQPEQKPPLSRQRLISCNNQPPTPVSDFAISLDVSM